MASLRLSWDMGRVISYGGKDGFGNDGFGSGFVKLGQYSSFSEEEISIQPISDFLEELVFVKQFYTNLRGEVFFVKQLYFNLLGEVISLK